MDLVKLAKGVLEEEDDEEVEVEESRSLPAPFSSNPHNKLTNFARGHEALLRRAKFGQTWIEIAEAMGFVTPAAAYKSAQRARKKLELEGKDDLRFRQRLRLDNLYDALQPAIDRKDKNTPRAVEVAVKVLERESRLEGLDLEGVTPPEGGKAIIIQFEAHPDDPGARQLLSQENPALPAPIIDAEEFEEVHMPDRGDG